MRSSAGLSMDGSRSIALDGAPDLISQTRPVDSLAVPLGFSTPPLPLPRPLGFAIGTRRGHVLFFNDRDSLTSTLALLDQSPLDQLLCDSSTLYTVSLSGSVNAYSFDGKSRWSAAVGATLNTSAVIANDQLLLPTDSNLIAIDLKTGSKKWERKSGCSVSALSYSAALKQIVVSMEHHGASGADTLLALDANGVTKGVTVLTGLRVTSNLAITSLKKQTICFGYLGEATEQRRPAFVAEYPWPSMTQTKPIAIHPVQFIAGSVGVNASAIFASGFRTLESEVVSGIDAFALGDTAHLWSRRFTEPLATPVAVGESNLYFTLSFESEAQVGSRGLFYTLQAGDGKTISERAMPGALHGFGAGIPMPDEQGRFLIADREKPTVYVLDRSTLKRVF
ncbi:MAG: PQQ-binding-like beta-propeller repeat protein [Candidatus Kapaibacterium sp.]